jgi:alpha-tubulin suppressor-like RCC1 family protein
MTNPRRMQMATAGQGEVLGYELWVWGVGTNGGLGVGNTTNYSSPVQVGSEAEWVHVFPNAYNMQGIKTDGTMWSWGLGTDGRNGTNNTTTYSSPVQVGTKTNWVHISGTASKVALDSSGYLWTWGKGTSGMLGNGSTSSTSVPGQVGTDTWTHVSSGETSMLAVRSDGTLWGWGGNDGGDIGVGNTTSYSSPVQVGSLTNWETAIALSWSAGAVKTDGTLWTWGSGDGGMNGDGTATNNSSPTQVGSLTDWGGGQFRGSHGGNYRAIKTDGTLWFWGADGKGVNGNGSANNSNRSLATQTGSLTNWYNGTPADGYRDMSAGTQNRTIVKSDGTLWCWGRAQFGQTGQSNTTDLHSPVQVGSGTNWFNAGGGTYMSAALKDVS